MLQLKKNDHENIKKTPAKLAYFSKIEEFFPFCPDPRMKTDVGNVSQDTSTCVPICGRNIEHQKLK